jgi:hypothetical protein
MCFTLFLGSTIEFWHHREKEQNEHRLTIQVRYNELHTRIASHMSLMGKTLEKQKKEPFLLSFPSMFIFDGLNGRYTLEKDFSLPSLSLNKNQITMRKRLSFGNKVLALQLPIKSLERLLGVSVLTHESKFTGLLHTSAGALYYPAKNDSFISAFTKERMPLLLICFSLGVILILLYLFLHALSMTRLKIYRKVHNKQTNDTIQDLIQKTNQMSLEIASLRREACLKNRHDRILRKKRQSLFCRRAGILDKSVCLSKLLKHEFMKNSPNSSLGGFVSELERSLGLLQMMKFEIGPEKKTDVGVALENIHDLLAPALSRRSLSWHSALNKNSFVHSVDPYLLDILLLCALKDVMSRALEGANLYMSVDTQGDTLHIEVKDGYVSQGADLQTEYIDLEFLEFPRHSLPVLAKSLGLRLDLKHNGIDISFRTQNHKEINFHENIIPLFA